ncbi:alkene reductase [Pedobacter sp. ISL-68]|uniref:alkene reductase n=1 Tax=unclassified Pedobacter TaxID=2628915 RepID=UPI001BEA7B4F|nr:MULTISPECIES: alkene reductase [unclassified Pedobacter]MBT2560186.1 alkene reductase [Pedobacter sp. ISL-64]MBT2589165.1 alkene reductase [Pedobacter sp. ISL-68]
MDTNSLFDNYNLNGLQLNNKMVMAPMTRSRSNNPENVATALTAEYYVQRATSGLIITEGTFVSSEAVGVVNVPGIYSKAQIEGWKLTTTAVHEKDGKIFAQLWHTGANSHPDLHGGDLPLAPSAINPNVKVFTAEGFKDSVMPKEMSLEDIKQTIADFKQGAINAFEANFDGIELHAANGYLFQQFFSKNSNTRTDSYGGSVENRSRFLFKVLEELKQVVDLARVGIRFNPSLHGMMGINVDDETIELYDYITNRLNAYGLAYIHLLEPFTDVSANQNAIPQVAKHFRKIYNGTIIINNGFNKEKATKIINDGDADLVSFGVPFLANPDLVERYKTDVPLNTPDQATFYTPGEKGYTDYPIFNH